MSAHYNKIEFSYGGENRKCYVYDDNGNKIRLTNHNILGCFRYEFVYSKMTLLLLQAVVFRCSIQPKIKSNNIKVPAMN